MTADLGATLLPIARAAIAQALGRTLLARDDARWLQKPGATFVTLTRDGQLRGCIGSLQGQRRLLDDGSGPTQWALRCAIRASHLWRHTNSTNS